MNNPDNVWIYIFQKREECLTSYDDINHFEHIWRINASSGCYFSPCDSITTIDGILTSWVRFSNVMDEVYMFDSPSNTVLKWSIKESMYTTSIEPHLPVNLWSIQPIPLLLYSNCSVKQNKRTSERANERTSEQGHQHVAKCLTIHQLSHCAIEFLLLFLFLYYTLLDDHLSHLSLDHLRSIFYFSTNIT